MTLIKDKISTLELGWMSGIIDGEGCFYARSKKTTILVRFTLQATSKAMVIKFKELLDQMQIRNRLREKTKTQKEHHRNSFILDVDTKKNVLKFLKVFTPHLIVKRQEAELLLEYFERACRVKVYKATEEDHQLVEKVKSLKKIV